MQAIDASARANLDMNEPNTVAIDGIMNKSNVQNEILKIQHLNNILEQPSGAVIPTVKLMPTSRYFTPPSNKETPAQGGE